ncbi:DMT family transporter [Prosthecomicrobium sp. N25]|uniref:DMT family transporter n=1 Tax=Prosthecomicrobium sp. N25 TaxID=3129254 RepID=UPI00307708B8
MSLAAAGPARDAQTLRGMGLMTAAMVIVPAMDILAKLLAQRLPPLEVAFGRMLVQMLLALAFAAATGALRTLLPPRFGVHLMRGFCLAGATLLFFTALRVMPLTDALAVFFVQPMILTALSALVLKERVDRRRWLACAVGFLGALVIVRPSWQVFGIHALMPLGTACLFSGYLLITRILAGTGTLMATQFVTGLGGTLLLGAALAVATLLGLEGAAARMPAGSDWLMFLGIGLISLVTHGLVVKAFESAPAAVLAPLNYLEIISATTLGFLVFGDFPDGPTWAGIVLIVGSGLAIVRREAGKAA